MELDSRSLKALRVSLSCEDLENRNAELGKFWAAPVSAPGKMLRLIQTEFNDPCSRHCKRVSFDENQSFFSFHVYILKLLNVYLFRRWRRLISDDSSSDSEQNDLSAPALQPV